MFLSKIFPAAFARIFQRLPEESIWEWADRNVWLVSQSAAEAGPYRSAKTPWTRRLQELARDRLVPSWSHEKKEWIWVELNEYTARKSSQSGLSEAALNIIRWLAKFMPCNVIYAIDTREEAKNIADRLLPSLKSIDSGIFTGDDDDVGTYIARLVDMTIWFIGSFSSGKYANKQAPVRISDELEEHGAEGTARELDSRGKTSDTGFQINLSKPKMVNGPIDKAYKRGNQEHFFFVCTHCGYRQWPSFFEGKVETVMDFQNLMEVVHPKTGKIILLPTPYDEGVTRKISTAQVVFEHCKTKLGEWDKLRILDEAAIQCASCSAQMTEAEKRALIQEAIWLPTAHGTPGSVSQQISDLFSSDRASSMGRLALDYLDAKKEGHVGLQKFHNHRLGLAWANEVAKTKESDILDNIAGANPEDNCPPYQRGTLPFIPRAIILGGDVGGNYAKWAIGAVGEGLGDIAVIDWGEELDPSSIADLMNSQRWTGPDGKQYRISIGFLDAKFRKGDVYKACLAVPGNRLIPTAGLGGSSARSGKIFSYHQVATYRSRLKQLTYNDREAKDDLYISKIQKKRARIYFPTNVADDPEFIAELCAEELVRDKNGVTTWEEHPGANHYGDCVKDINTGLRFLTRELQIETVAPPEPAAP